MLATHTQHFDVEFILAKPALAAFAFYFIAVLYFERYRINKQNEQNNKQII